MNWDQIEGNWHQLKGNVQYHWAKLTDDDLDMAAGKRDELADKIQEAYGVNQEDAVKQVDDWQQNNLSNWDDEDLESQIYYASLNDGMGDAGDDSQGPGDGAGLPGDDDNDDMDDSENPNPNPMPDDLDEPPRANHNETPHQDKSLDQT